MSKIEWTDVTWNPITGCTPVSPGCQNCYATRMAARLAGRFGYPKDKPFSVTFHRDRLDQPLRWRKPRKVFVSSMGDLFHGNAPDEWIDEVFGIAALCPEHTFQILTKRSERMTRYLNSPDRSFRVEMTGWQHCKRPTELPGGWPMSNVWLGTSVENQATADERIPHLLRCKAAVRFVSYEPMLGPLDLSGCMDPLSIGWVENIPTGPEGGSAVEWVILGCETGPGARPAEPEWFRSAIEQCGAANVPVFVKTFPIGGKVSKDPDEWPEWARRREWPEVT